MSACKFCKHEGFTWKQVNGKWRLFDANDELHRCPVFAQKTAAKQQASNQFWNSKPNPVSAGIKPKREPLSEWLLRLDRIKHDYE